MKTIGRKTYIHWGDKIVAVEILAEKPSEFKDRTGISVEENKSFVCEISDIFGERVERPVGQLLMEPNYTEITNFGSFLSSLKMISQNDIDQIAKSINTPTNLVHDVQINEHGEWIHQYNKEKGKINSGFIGFIELTKNTILKSFCPLTHICFTDINNTPFIPVYLFKEEKTFFDSADSDSEEKPFIVFFHGTDNCSYGERFTTIEEAEKFISKGFACALNKKLRFFNS